MIIIFVSFIRASDEEKPPLLARTKSALIKVLSPKKNKSSKPENEQVLYQKAQACCRDSRRLMQLACSRSYELSTYYNDHPQKQQKFLKHHEAGQNLMAEISDKRISNERPLADMMQLVHTVNEYMLEYIEKVSDSVYNIDCIGNLHPVGAIAPHYPIVGKIAIPREMPNFPILARLAELEADYELFLFDHKKTLSQKFTAALRRKK